MNGRAYFADLEAQTAAANRADRDERTAAFRDDPSDYTWINGRAYDVVTGPDTADRYES